MLPLWGQSRPGSNGNGMNTLHSLKLQTWIFIIRLFSVIKGHSLMGGLTSLQRRSYCILLPHWLIRFYSGVRRVWMQSFPFFPTDFKTKAKELSLTRYLPGAGKRKMNLSLSQRREVLPKTALSEIWSWIVLSNPTTLTLRISAPATFSLSMKY